MHKYLNQLLTVGKMDDVCWLRLFIPLDISANITKQFVSRNIIGEAILKSQRDIIGNLFLLINFGKHIDHNGNDTVSLLNMLELNLVNMEITIALPRFKFQVSRFKYLGFKFQDSRDLDSGFKIQVSGVLSL